MEKLDEHLTREDPDVVEFDSEEWERMNEEANDAFLSDLADDIADAINHAPAHGTLGMLTGDARGMLTNEGYVVYLPMGNREVRLRLFVPEDENV